MHSWAAVVLMTWQCVNAFDFRNDQLLFLLSGRRLAAKPFVESCASDFQDLAKNIDGPAVAMFFDELKSQPFSLAKKAVAFFKMSRSILS